MPTITPGNQALSLAQAQTANMNAAAYNRATPGAVQISGGTTVGSSGSYNPSTVQTPSAPSSTPAMVAANISTSPTVSTPTGTGTTATAIGTPRAGVAAPIAGTTNIVSQKRSVGITKPLAENTQTLTGKPVSTPVPTVKPEGTDQFPFGTFPTKTPAVKPVAPTAPAVPVKPTTPDLYSTATPEQKSNADQMLKMIDPTGQLNPAAQADIRNAIIDGKEASIQGVANAYNLNYQNIKDTTDAYKLTRDVAMQDQFNKQQTDQKLAQSKQEYDTAWRQQKDKLEATANNMAVLQDTTGRLQSRNMVGAITQQLDEQQRLLENINQNQQWAAQDIVNTAKYNHDLLANQYNDRMAGYDASMGAKIKALADTGMANTMDGLKAAQSLVEQTLNQKMETGYTYAKALENATKIVQMQIKQRTPNAEMSNTMNDGYLHNDAGEIIMGAKGEPLAYNPQKKVQSTVSDGKGGMIAIYTDGTHGPIYEGKLATNEEVQNYAKMVQQYGVVAMNMLPDQVKSQVMAYIGQSGMSPTKEAQWAVIGQHYDENTGLMVNDYGFVDTTNRTTTSSTSPTSGTPTTNMGDLRGLASQFPGQAWAKNNNPAGITWNANFDNPKPGSTAQRLIDAGVNFSKGTPRPGNEGGNYVTFPTIEDGLKAQRIMMSGTYGNTTVGKMLSSWVGTSEGPNYAKQVSGMAGIDPNTPVSSLSDEQLSTLQMAKIQKESPGLAKLLKSDQSTSTQTSTAPTPNNPLGLFSPLVDFAKQLVNPNQAQTQQTTPAQTYTPAQKNILEGYGKKSSEGTLDAKGRADIARQLGVKPDQLSNMYNDFVSNVPEVEIKSSALPLFKNYIEDGVLPSKDALKGLGMTSEQFTDSASTGYDKYLRSKEAEINSTYPTLNINFTPSYNNISATQKEKLNESMTNIGDIDQRIGQLKKLFQDNGTEVWPTKAKSTMETLRKQIILKAKEVENLGVLNGPDLGILEDLLPSTTGFVSGVASFDDNTLAKLDNIRDNYRSDAKTKGINYGAKISFKDESQPEGQPQTGNPVGLKLR